MVKAAERAERHGVVDDVFGVVLEVEVRAGKADEGERRLARLDAVAETTGVAIATVTADAGHAHGPTVQRDDQDENRAARHRGDPSQGRADPLEASDAPLAT